MKLVGEKLFIDVFTALCYTIDAVIGEDPIAPGESNLR